MLARRWHVAGCTTSVIVAPDAPVKWVHLLWVFSWRNSSTALTGFSPTESPSGLVHRPPNLDSPVAAMTPSTGPSDIVVGGASAVRRCAGHHFNIGIGRTSLA